MPPRPAGRNEGDKIPALPHGFPSPDAARGDGGPGRACHSVRAVVVNPDAWVGNRGVQTIARPTRVNALDLAFGTFQKIVFNRVIRVSVLVFISGSGVTLEFASQFRSGGAICGSGGRACHSVRAVVVNPDAWVGNRGVQGTARPTRVNALDLAFGTFQKTVFNCVIRVSVLVFVSGSGVTLEFASQSRFGGLFVGVAVGRVAPCAPSWSTRTRGLAIVACRGLPALPADVPRYSWTALFRRSG